MHFPVIHFFCFVMRIFFINGRFSCGYKCQKIAILDRTSDRVLYCLQISFRIFPLPLGRGFCLHNSETQNEVRLCWDIWILSSVAISLLLVFSYIWSCARSCVWHIPTNFKQQKKQTMLDVWCCEGWTKGSRRAALTRTQQSFNVIVIHLIFLYFYTCKY